MFACALNKVVVEGGKIIVEGGVLSGNGYESGCYVKPAIAEAKPNFNIVQNETFAPVLYVNTEYNYIFSGLDSNG